MPDWDYSEMNHVAVEEVGDLRPKYLRPSTTRMSRYYEDKLSADGLRKCYRIAPPRIRQYLKAEADFVIDAVRGCGEVLELGCGYGRVMKLMARHVGSIVGCDTSRRSLKLARRTMHAFSNIHLLCADAAYLPFQQGVFDAVFCIQNGISAFGVDRQQLVTEALRATEAGGLVLFSTYSRKIWRERLAWFRAQSEAGLIGEIDEVRTGIGTIVCKDGFRATTVRASEFMKLFSEAGAKPRIREVDESSLFCLARK